MSNMHDLHHIVAISLGCHCYTTIRGLFCANDITNIFNNREIIKVIEL